MKKVLFLIVTIATFCSSAFAIDNLKTGATMQDGLFCGNTTSTSADKVTSLVAVNKPVSEPPRGETLWNTLIIGSIGSKFDNRMIKIGAYSNLCKNNIGSGAGGTLVLSNSRRYEVGWHNIKI